MNPKPFLRGVAFAGTDRVPYPRANPADAPRLPLDTWMQAQVPAGVRLELTGDAAAIQIGYVTTTDKLGFRGEGAGTTFQLWSGGAPVSEERAVLGEGKVRLKLGEGGRDAVRVVYLPEGMKPRVTSIDAVDGTVEPVSPRPRWVAYGDSIAEGWSASSPALSWTATVARERGLDLVNMGYAGAARGEIVSAEHVAALHADVISITHGTNCWKRIPHSAKQMRANTAAFIDIIRKGHPETPIVVVTPVVRPEAETTPNALGATLVDLRREMARAVTDRDDPHTVLVGGRDIITEAMLADSTHPNDDGHRALADALGPVVAAAVERVRP